LAASFVLDFQTARYGRFRLFCDLSRTRADVPREFGNKHSYRGATRREQRHVPRF
jgi:hypothetical protein